MKVVIVAFLVVILYTLASSLWFLVRDSGESTDVVRRLSWRIGLSVLLFLFLWVAYQLGWIEPNSGPVRMPPPQTQIPE
jgi:hypothetical protein